MKLKVGISLVLTIFSITLFAQSPLSGIYTIAPSGGDFSSFSEAVDSLKANGISSTVTFNVAAGTYEEFFEIDSIAGASESAQILFVGENASTTVLNVALNTESPTVSLNGAAYIQFHHFTIAHEEHTDFVDGTINIGNNSKYIVLKNCHITSGANVLNHVKIKNAQNIEIDSCQLYDNGFRNVDVEDCEAISITNSEFIGDGLAFQSIRGVTLINNQLTYKRGRVIGNVTTTALGAYYMSDVSDYYIEKNIVNAIDITIGLYIKNLPSDSVQHTILPTIKNNVFLGDVGGYLIPVDSIKIIHSSFIGTETGLSMNVTDSIGGVSELNLQIENNLFAGSRFAALSMNGSLDSTCIMDYNAYLIDTDVENVIILHPFYAFLGEGAYSDLAIYQADYPYHDEHSQLIDINYLATDDYHINSATEFHFGRNDLGITEDAEGDPRGLFGDAVDVGGDEFAGYVANIYKISGRLFLDENGNGIQDGDEYGLANRKVYQALDDVTTLTDENGDYYFYTIDGNSYTISPEERTGFAASPADSTVAIGAYDIDSVNFAYQIVTQTPEIEVDFTTGFKRCFRTINGYISYENTGSVQDDFTISLTLAQDYVLESAEPSWDSEVNGTYYWNIEDLSIFESGLIRLQITMPGVDAIGVEQTTLLSAENADSTLTEKTYIDEISCSYDPNDKTVYPKGFGEDHLVLKTDSLEYLIRFQNTGNDTAFDIRIQDQLSTELDLSTFELISASHQVRTELNEATNQLIFYFDDIQLVDSVANEPESHGYVKYRVKAKEAVLDSTEILNTAYIYFDFNPPIITNTVSSMMVDEIPQEFITALPSVVDASLLIYPNPTEGLLTINIPNAKPIFLEVLSLDGRTVHQHHYSDAKIKLDLSLLPPSMYIIKIQGKDYQVQERIVIR